MQSFHTILTRILSQISWLLNAYRKAENLWWLDMPGVILGLTADASKFTLGMFLT